MLGFGSKRKEETAEEAAARQIREARQASDIAMNHFNEVTEPGYITEASAGVTKADAHFNTVLAEAKGQAPAEVEITVMVLPEDPLASSIIRDLAEIVCKALGVPEAIVKTRVIQ
jgi:hypothetical protein